MAEQKTHVFIITYHPNGETTPRNTIKFTYVSPPSVQESTFIQALIKTMEYFRKNLDAIQKKQTTTLSLPNKTTKEIFPYKPEKIQPDTQKEEKRTLQEDYYNDFYN